MGLPWSYRSWETEERLRSAVSLPASLAGVACMLAYRDWEKARVEE